MQIVRLHRFAVLASVCTLTLVVLSAFVTSSAGGALAWNEIHRAAIMIVGLLIVALAACVARTQPGKLVRGAAFLAAGAVGLQALLGALASITAPPEAVAAAHGLLAHIVFAASAAVAVCTSAGWQSPAPSVADGGWPSLRSLAVATPLFVVAQVVLGASYRHDILGLLPHVLGALAVTVFGLMFAVFAILQCQDHNPIQQAAKVFAGVTFLQVLLGIAAYLGRVTGANGAGRAVSALPVAHVAVGSLTLAASVILAIHILRYVYAPAADLSHTAAAAP